MDSLTQAFSNAVQWTGDTASSAAGAVSNASSVAWNATSDAASSAWTATKDTASSAWNATTNTASAAWDATKSGASATANGLATAGILATTTIPTAGYLGTDAAMRSQVGKSDYSSFGKWPAVEAITKPITVTIPFQRGAQGAAAAATSQTGPGATVQAPGSSFLYLDVGRWGGDKASAKRDFGIVCGGTAAICAFTDGSTGPYTSFAGAKTTLTDGPQDEIGPINALLGQLAGSKLGTPQVRRYLTSKAPRPPGVTLSHKIYIILGDMHLPTVTGPEPKEQTDLLGKRVGRTRRTDAFKDMGVMSDSDAALWHERYISGEIFQTGGPDLRMLIEQLQKAQGKVIAELWLLQLGDMFDLWLGFDCFLKSDPPRFTKRWGDDGQVILQDMIVTPTPPPDPDGLGTSLADMTPTTVTTAKDFIETWVDRTLNHTTQGEFVKTFLGFDHHHSMFLYGNHDNYLGKLTPSLLSNLSGGNLAKDFYDAQSLFYGCHGHQFDNFNRDGATAGNITTQTAFWGGTFMRNMEPDTREPTILGAAALFRKGVKPFGVFAMGHTHHALLAEIVNVMAPEPPPPPPPDPYMD